MIISISNNAFHHGALINRRIRMSQNNNVNPYDAYPYGGPYPQFENPEMAYRQQGYQQQPYPPAYQPTTFPQQQQPGQQIPFPTSAPAPSGPQVPGMLPVEESYIENILRLNKGKLVSLHATFENNKEWNARVFKGVIEAAGRDHVIISDPQTGKRYLIPMVYVDFITFDEEIEYEYPFGGGGPGLASYPPR